MIKKNNKKATLKITNKVSLGFILNYFFLSACCYSLFQVAFINNYTYVFIYIYVYSIQLW